MKKPGALVPIVLEGEARQPPTALERYDAARQRVLGHIVALQRSPLVMHREQGMLLESRVVQEIHQQAAVEDLIDRVHALIETEREQDGRHQDRLRPPEEWDETTRNDLFGIIQHVMAMTRFDKTAAANTLQLHRHELTLIVTSEAWADWSGNSRRLNEKIDALQDVALNTLAAFLTTPASSERMMVNQAKVASEVLLRSRHVGMSRDTYGKTSRGQDPMTGREKRAPVPDESTTRMRPAVDFDDDNYERPTRRAAAPSPAAEEEEPWLAD